MAVNTSLTRKTLTNSAWQFAATAFQGVALLAVTAVLARLLEPKDFGLVATANIVIGFAAMFTRFGVGQAVIQREDLTQLHVRVAFTISVLMAVILIAVLMTLAPALAWFLGNPDVTLVMQVLSLSFLFDNLGTVANSLLARDLAFQKLFWVTVATYAFGYGLVGIGLAAMGLGVWALVSAALVSKLSYSLLSMVLRPHPVQPSLSRKELGELLKFGGGMTLSAILKYVANNGDYFVIGRWLGAAALGVYQQAFNLLVIFARYMGDVLERVLFTTASRIQDNPLRIARAYGRALSIVNLCLFPLSIIMIVLAPEIISIYLGPKWGEAVVPAQILLLGLTLRTQSRISDAFVHALGSVYRPAARKGVFAAVVVLGSLYAQQWGIVGVAAAVTFAMLIDYLLVLDLGLRLTATGWRRHVINMLPGIVIGGVVLLLCLPTAHFLRLLSLGPLVVLIGSLLPVLLAVVVVIKKFPSLLGSSGAWFMNVVLDMLPQRGWAANFQLTRPRK